MTEPENQAPRVAERLAAHRQALIRDLHQLLKDALFSGSAPLHPSALPRIAQAEANAFFDFLQRPDGVLAMNRGAQLCQEGVGFLAVLHMQETLWRFCRAHLAERVDLLMPGLEAAGTFHAALMQGFIQAQAARIISEQERLRSAFERRLDQYAAENAQLYQTERAYRQELALAHRQSLAMREQEQRRLARELHDLAVQELLVVNYRLADARRKADGARPPNAQRMAEIRTALETMRREVLGVVSQLRTLVGELRPAGLEELGLTIALEGYVEQLKQQGSPGMPEIELDLDQSKTTLPEPIAICIFRVAQESLRNALKHAQAQHIRVSLRLAPNEAALYVRDDGCGFRVPARLSELVQSNRFGLVGMTERVTTVSGQLTIRSQPGGGTEVIARIPLTNGKGRMTKDE
jgi:signal transduction histidine kinase